MTKRADDHACCDLDAKVAAGLYSFAPGFEPHDYDAFTEPRINADGSGVAPALHRGRSLFRK